VSRDRQTPILAVSYRSTARINFVPPPDKIDTKKYPIFAYAEKEWPANKSDCSAYVKAVAHDLGVVLAGQANDLVDFWTSHAPWINLGHDAAKASAYAADGYLVFAGEKQKPNGHVVLIVPGTSANGYPMGYWGQLHRVGRKNASISLAWIGDSMWNTPAVKKAFPHNKKDPSPLDNVLYFALSLPQKLKLGAGK
jgi:hypothetical protein